MPLLHRIPLRLWRLAFAVCLFAVMVLALLPDPDPRLSTGWDKGNHLLAFGVLAFLGCAALRGRWLLVTAGLLGYGVLIELAQDLTGYRYAEWADLLADGLGIGLGLGLFGLHTWLHHRLTFKSGDTP